VDLNSLFSDLDPHIFFSDPDSDLYFDLKCFVMVPLITFIFVLEPVRMRKILFSFKCLSCDFSQKFSFYNSVWIQIRTFFRIRIHPKLTDSFGFVSTTLVKIIVVCLMKLLQPGDEVRYRIKYGAINYNREYSGYDFFFVKNEDREPRLSNTDAYSVP
jgi:hypothetical protein